VLISCEKCSTTYVLDDALIPAQGAPVQCTRCGHVFTAKLPAKDLATTTPGQPTWDAGKKPGGATIAFGQAAVPGAGQPAGHQTMMFGAAGAVPAGKAPPPPVAPPGKQTMVFGAPAAGSAPPAGKQTMVFGAAGAPPPAAPPGKQTMVFGAAGAPPPVPPPPAAKQTMVFGAAPPAAPAPAGKQTMVFGAAPAAPAPASKQTMVFGAPVEEPSPEPASKQTMMFGRAPRVTQAPPGVEPTERSESTVRVDLEAMMRGHTEEPDPAVQARHDRTQRYAMTDAQRTPSPGSESVEARHNRTQLFAMNPQQETTKPDANVPAPSPADWAQRPGDSTLPPSFADMPTLEPDGSPARPPAPVAQTLVFGAHGPRAQVTTDPGLDPPGVRVLLEPGMATPPEALASAPQPIATTMPNLAPIERSQELPPLRVELPPEPSFASGQAQTQRNFDAPAAPDDAALAELRRSSGRRTAIAVVIFLIIALGLGLAVLWHLFGRSLLSGESGNGRAAADQAVARLRMDDADSRAAATRELAELLKARPTLVDARAGLVLALAFAFDDQTALVAALEEKAKQGRTDARTVNQAKTKRLEAQVALKNELEVLEAAAKTMQPGSPEELLILRSLAVAAGTLGDPRALVLTEQYHQKSKAVDDWVDLAMPEYQVVAGTSREDALKQLEEVRGRKSNSTFFRVLMLTARLHLRNSDLQAAEEALKTVTTLNSKHELAAVMLDVLVAGAAREGDAVAAPSAARDPRLNRE
jgi:predicted Zn finger-like uncharacterized protein